MRSQKKTLRPAHRSGVLGRSALVTGALLAGWLLPQAGLGEPSEHREGRTHQVEGGHKNKGDRGGETGDRPERPAEKKAPGKEREGRQGEHAAAKAAEMETKHRHLMEAAKNLRAAGLGEEARKLHEKAANLKEKMEDARTPDRPEPDARRARARREGLAGEPRGSGHRHRIERIERRMEGPRNSRRADVQAELRRLRHEIHAVRQELDRLKDHLRQRRQATRERGHHWEERFEDPEGPRFSEGPRFHPRFRRGEDRFEHRGPERRDGGSRHEDPEAWGEERPRPEREDEERRPGTREDREATDFD